MKWLKERTCENLMALGLCLLFIGQNGTAWAAAADQESTPAQVGYGAGSAVGTLVYTPAKGVFCIFGAIGSIFALPFGTSSAEKVVGTTCRGTWVITPEALKGREQVQFVGNPAPETAPKK